MSVNVKIGGNTVENIDTVKLENADEVGTYAEFELAGGGSPLYYHQTRIYAYETNSNQYYYCYFNYYDYSSEEVNTKAKMIEVLKKYGKPTSNQGVISTYEVQAYGRAINGTNVYVYGLRYNVAPNKVVICIGYNANEYRSDDASSYTDYVSSVS